MTDEMDPVACRRLVVSLLLLACLDAEKGDQGALEWINSDGAAHLAEAVGYGDNWPPPPRQLAPRRELQARVRDAYGASAAQVF